jgi:thioredoxin domain-containing protein 5
MTKLRAALHRLSLSFLLASVCLEAVTSAAIPETKKLQLTPDDFTSTTASGNWYIEFFSPYCGHCRKFAPTWEKLIEHVESSSDLTMKLAQVDCSKYGDLCTENHVTGYPQMNFYNEGQYIDTFKKGRELNILTKFLEEKEEKYGAPKKAAAMEDVFEETSSVVLNSHGLVVPITPDTFLHTIAQGPTLVKYYAPWCGHCKKLAPIWVQLAKHMQNKLNVVELNCDEHEAFCKTQQVKGFPTLTFYSNGAITEYSGGRKLEQLKSFADKATRPTLTPIQPDDLGGKLAESQVSYLLVYPESDKRLVAQMNQASSALLGSVPIYTSSSPSLFSQYSVSSPWALLAFKHQIHSATFTSTLDDPSSEVRQWLLTNRLPAALELKQDTFQEVMKAKHEPLVVIAAVSSATQATVSEKMIEIGKKWVAKKAGTHEVNKVVFTWMDVERWEKWMKSMYSVKGLPSAIDPPIVIADHGRLTFANQDRNGQPIKFSALTVFAAVEDALAGNLTFQSSENFVERLARYMSARITAGEDFVRENLLMTVLFILGGGGLMFYLFVRWLSVEDVSREYNQWHTGKGERLD